MATHSSLSALLLVTTSLLLLVLVVAVGAVGIQEVGKKRTSIAAKDEQIDNMPDTSNPAVMKELQCSACKAAAREAYEALWNLHTLRRGSVQEFEYDDMFDNHCQIIKRKYGLLMRKNKPTNELSRNTAISRVQGIWVGTMVEDACAELLDKYQDRMIKEYPNSHLYKEFQQWACNNWNKKGKEVCTIPEIIKDEV